MISMPCKKPELYNYSPHRGRMALLDQVEQANLEKKTLEASLRVSLSSEFFNKKQGHIPIWISFEYMAQSIATLSGMINMAKGESPTIGFIMGVRNFIAHKAGFSPNDEVRVLVYQTFRDGDVAVFEGETMVDGFLYSSGTLSVIENSSGLLTRWNVLGAQQK